jgi:hypothetical protein
LAETFIAVITSSLCTDALTKSLTAVASRTNDDTSDAEVDVEMFSALALLLGAGSAVAGSVTVNFRTQVSVESGRHISQQ